MFERFQAEAAGAWEPHGSGEAGASPEVLAGPCALVPFRRDAFDICAEPQCLGQLSV